MKTSLTYILRNLEVVDRYIIAFTINERSFGLVVCYCEGKGEIRGEEVEKERGKE